MTTWQRLAPLKVRRSCAAVFLLASAHAMAVERPTLPAPGPDLKLTGGKSPAEFFGARLQNKACQEQLTATRQIFHSADREVRKLVLEKAATAQIDQAERFMPGAREAYLDKLEACGPCASKEIEKRKILSVTKTEIWNISDGSCWLDPKKFGKPAFEKMRAYLSRTDSYAAYQTEGLRNILEFVPIDSANGSLHSEWITFDKPFFVFISVLGPSVFGEQLAPQYVIQNEVKEKGNVSWTLEFKGVTAPRGFRAPDVYLRAASGRKTLTRAMKLPSVLGQWHLDSEGTLRYFTAADFGVLGVASGFTEKLARSVILETLSEVYEIAAGEKP